LIEISISKKNKNLIYIALIVYWFFLFIATTLPSISPPIKFELSDKVYHLVAFIILAFLLSISLEIQNFSKTLKKNFLIYAAIIAILYGGIDELHQMYVPNRSCDIYDWLADILGAIIGIGLRKLIYLNFIET